MPTRFFFFFVLIYSLRGPSPIKDFTKVVRTKYLIVRLSPGPSARSPQETTTGALPPGLSSHYDNVQDVYA